MDINTILRAKIFGKANTDIETLALANILGGGQPEENLLEMIPENVALNKYINNSGQVQSSDPNFYYSKPIPVGAKDTVTLTCSEALNYVSFMEYDENGTFIQRTLYGGSGSAAVGNTVSHTVGATTASILWGSNPDGTKVASSIFGWKWKLTRTINNLIDPEATKQNTSLSGGGTNFEAYESTLNGYVLYKTKPLERTGSTTFVVTFVPHSDTGAIGGAIWAIEGGYTLGAQNPKTTISSLGEGLPKTLTRAFNLNTQYGGKTRSGLAIYMPETCTQVCITIEE